MAQYQLWIEDWSYTKQALIARYMKCKFRLLVNGVGYAELVIPPDGVALDYLDVMDRFKIIRDGTVIWGGIFQREEFNILGKAPEGGGYTFYAKDHAEYANWRLILPPDGYEYDERTGAADDLAKEYVHNHIGAGADAGRQLSDVIEEGDESACAAVTEKGRYEYVSDVLDRLQRVGGFDWRFVAGVAGCVFQTAYPQWGLDRTKGNGVNDECVFSLDRKTFQELSYTKDLIPHRNFAYVLGEGDAETRDVTERSDAGAITNYKRREMAVEARNYDVEAEYQAAGDAALAENDVSETIMVTPKLGTWRGLGGTTTGIWDLGDLVTCYAHRHGGTWERNAKVVAIDVDLAPRRAEIVKPVLEIIEEDIGS